MTRSPVTHQRGTREIALSLAALALVAGAPALRARESRITVTPFVSGVWTTPLFHNDTL